MQDVVCCMLLTAHFCAPSPPRRLICTPHAAAWTRHLLLMAQAGSGHNPAVLPAAYLMQYLPSVGMMLMCIIGPGRAQQIKTGGSGYDLKSMLGKPDQKN